MIVHSHWSAFTRPKAKLSVELMQACDGIQEVLKVYGEEEEEGLDG